MLNNMYWAWGIMCYNRGMKKNIKKIGIDARFYGSVGKGLGRYTQEVVDNILALDNENEYVIFLSKENFTGFKSDNPRVKKILTGARWYTLAEQIIMPYLVWREGLDLMHWPHFNVPIFCSVKFVVTIHDLILTKFPTTRATTLGPLFYRIKNWGYKLVIYLAVKRARCVVAVSRFTKDDIVKQFKVDKKKIVVTYEGVSKLSQTKYFDDDKEAFLRYNINKPFLLYVGNAYPHKNLEGLIKNFFRLHKSEPDLKLVLVGKEDYFYKRVQKYANSLWTNDKNKNPVIFPGFIPDRELAILFKKARAYIFPSFYEGFGLPPLEAMSYGCPVVSSDSSSLPEVLGQSALYFRSEDEEDMLAKIKKIIKDESLRQELIVKGYKQAKKYSWEECAHETLEIYRKILQDEKKE